MSNTSKPYSKENILEGIIYYFSNLFTITSTTGVGGSTTVDNLSKKIGLPHYRVVSGGGIMRSFAKDYSMSIEAFAKYCKENPEKGFDKKCDETIQAFAEQNFCIIEGRLPHVFAPHAFHVLLVCDNLDVLVERRFQYGKKKAKGRSYPARQEVRKNIEERDKDDNARYEALYPGCLWPEEDYDCVVDTSLMDPQEVIGMVIGTHKHWIKKIGDKIVTRVTIS